MTWESGPTGELGETKNHLWKVPRSSRISLDAEPLSTIYRETKCENIALVKHVHDRYLYPTGNLLLQGLVWLSRTRPRRLLTVNASSLPCHALGFPCFTFINVPHLRMLGACDEPYANGYCCSVHLVVQPGATIDGCEFSCRDHKLFSCPLP
jgi:hypothetical protein